VDLDALGNLGEFVGGLAVIASLIYLAVQIRQNTKTLRLQVEQSIKRDNFELRRTIIQDAGLADLTARSIEDDDSLSPAERIRVNLGVANLMEHLQQQFMLRDQGLVRWEVQEWALRSYMAQPAFLRWWDSGRNLLLPEFVEYVEREILPTAEGTRTHWQP
jgi:hypothetical protein